MHTPRSNVTSGRRSPLRRLAWPFAWIAAVLGVLGLAMPPVASAGASTTPPPTVTISLSTDNSTLIVDATKPNVGVPAVLAMPGTPIALDLTSSSPFNQNVTFNLMVALSSGSTPSGTLTPNQVTLTAGQTVAHTTVTYSGVDNGVTITGVPAKKQPTVNSLPSQPFDSLRHYKLYDNPGIGTSATVGDDLCTQTSTDTNCGVAVLPMGFTSSQAAVSTGLSTGVLCGPDLKACKSGSTIVQFIADVSGANYTATSPATLIIRCDKTQCGNGGVNKFNVYYTLSASGPLNIQAPACDVKGQTNVAPDGTPIPCVDYVNSSRDNAGDLLLWLNFTDDIRSTGY